MMKIYEIGMTEKELSEMIYVNPMLEDITDEEIDDKIELLKSIGCQDEDILHIVTSNPFCLTNDLDAMKETITYLNDFDINPLWVIFSVNPYALNLWKMEIEEYIELQLAKGIGMDDIIDHLEETFFIEL